MSRKSLVNVPEKPHHIFIYVSNIFSAFPLCLATLISSTPHNQSINSAYQFFLPNMSPCDHLS